MWPVRQKYELVGESRVARKGRVVHRYDPTEYPSVVGEIGKLYEGDTGRVLDFAHTWGMLGWQHPQEQEAAEPLAWLWSHASNVRLVLQMAYFLQTQDERGLDTLLTAYCSPEELEVESGPHMYIAQPDWPPHEVAFRWRPGDATQVAREVSSFIVQANLEEIRPLQPKPDTSSLRAATYQHLRNVVLGRRSVVRCDNAACRALFVARDKRQRYCPAPPPWTDGKDSLCAVRDRMRRHRERKGS